MNIDVQEKHGLVASRSLPTRDMAHNLGMCPLQESYLQHFGMQDDDQTTEIHQSGPLVIFFFKDFIYL